MVRTSCPDVLPSAPLVHQRRHTAAINMVLQILRQAGQKNIDKCTYFGINPQPCPLWRTLPHDSKLPPRRGDVSGVNAPPHKWRRFWARDGRGMVLRRSVLSSTPAVTVAVENRGWRKRGSTLQQAIQSNTEVMKGGNTHRSSHAAALP